MLFLLLAACYAQIPAPGIPTPAPKSPPTNAPSMATPAPQSDYRVLLSKVHGEEPSRWLMRCIRANQETTKALKDKVKAPTLAAPEDTETLEATFLNAKLPTGLL